MKLTIPAAIAAITLTFSFNTVAGSYKADKDINSLVDVAVAVNSENSPFAGSFDTLIALLTQDVEGRSDILKALDSKGQYTVFAPTDDAFSELEATVQTLGYCSLGDLDPKVVNAVLMYHVAEGRWNSDQVVGAREINMLAGGSLRQDSAVLTDNLDRTSNLITAALNVEADNGIIHAMDSVVLPVLPEPGPGNCS
ncbi:MAG: fasciclin domain-containing protein [Amphritea sp.]|nr:fasciclin domain-containing protein [Amphritea sp.]